MTLIERLYVWSSCDLNVENLPIRIGQMRVRLENYPLMIVSQILMATLLCALMWDVVAHRLLLGWLSALYSIHLIEAYFWLRYRGRLQNIEECKAWRARFIVFVSLVGVVWGAAGVLMFVPGDLAYQALLICVILGLAAGAVTLNPVFPPALFIYVGLLITPTIFCNLLVGDRTHAILAVMLTVYLVFVLNAGRGLSRTFEQSLRGEWENARLVGQLVKEKSRAEQAGRMKSKFFVAANHDLRQPMHAISMYVEVLKSSPLDEHAKAAVAQLKHSIEIMSAIFDTLLEISKLDAGVVQLHQQSFDLTPLLDGLYTEFDMLARDKGIQLEMERTAGTIYSDPVLLERILRNLISNAINFTEHGEVKFRCKRSATSLTIEVCDSGIGIAPEHLPHIFEEYYQVGNKQRDRTKGLGLGLSIVDRLTKLLGYDMQVHSGPGAGSCFSFEVPQYNTDVMMRDKQSV